jgi:DNA-binding response OmpR family regulator
VIVLTSSVNPTDKARALELGVKEYIVKPTDLDAFLKAGRGALERWTGGTAKFVGGTQAETLPGAYHRGLSVVKPIPYYFVDRFV